MLWERILQLLFPPKCVLCGRILSSRETDLCAACRKQAPCVENRKEKHPHLAQWTGVWYYEKEVRSSLHRYKFRGRSCYSDAYGRFLAVKIQQDLPEFDLLTWVPISQKRLHQRGYDQSRLLAEAVGRELGVEPVAALEKVRHNPPQSGVQGAQERRANVLGVFALRQDVAGKRVLLIDDILTTGATVSECARVLRTGGAQQVYAAAVAVARRNSTTKNR